MIDVLSISDAYAGSLFASESLAESGWLPVSSDEPCTAAVLHADSSKANIKIIETNVAVFRIFIDIISNYHKFFIYIIFVLCVVIVKDM